MFRIITRIEHSENKVMFHSLIYLLTPESASFDQFNALGRSIPSFSPMLWFRRDLPSVFVFSAKTESVYVPADLISRSHLLREWRFRVAQSGLVLDRTVEGYIFWQNELSFVSSKAV